MNRVAAAAFPADAREEPNPVFDEVSGPHDVAEDIPGDKDDLDQDLLDALPLPGEPKLEGERRREWNNTLYEFAPRFADCTDSLAMCRTRS